MSPLSLHHTARAVGLALGLLSLSACDLGGDDPQVVTLSKKAAIAIGDSQCWNGGDLVQSGGDRNFNGTLDNDEITSSEKVCKAALAPTWLQRSFTINPALKTVAIPGGKTLNLTLGVGSGAFRRASDAPGMFWTVSDRGPNLDCGASEKLAGIKDLCKTSAGAVDNLGKIFPTPDFTPSIYQWQIEQNSAGNARLVLKNTITLKDKDGAPISGRSNELKVTNTEVSYDVQGKPLAFDNEGLDTEALAVLNDGSFWLAEEYGPSIVRVAADGKILERIVPAGMENDLKNANYPVRGLLPAILARRTLNRGAESIGVTADNKYLYVAMQNPLSNPDGATYATARNTRVLKVALANGAFDRVVGEYLYVLDSAQTYGNLAEKTGDLSNGLPMKQSDVKVSELLVLGEDDLLVLERISKVTKLYRVNLKTADNVLDGAADQLTQTPSVESLLDTRRVFNAKPVVKQLVFNSLTDAGSLNVPEKIEGVALLDNNNLLLINDNDFAIEGASTGVLVYPLAANQLGSTPKRLSLSQLGRYDSGVFAEGAAEIVAYDAASKRLFVVNAKAATVDVLDVSNPAAPSRVHQINVGAVAANLGAANSVAVHNGVLAVAIEASPKTANGRVAFYNTSDYRLLNAVTVGALPDMLTFTPDGKRVLVANEGEPADDYSVDPQGSISIINLAGGVAAATVKTLGFADFNVGGARAAELPAGVRIYGPNASVASDLEPEYITVSADGSKAWVSLQEANAVAVLDLVYERIAGISALGLKDHGAAFNELDASDRDNTTALKSWKNVFGMYQPDAIAALRAGGRDYVVSANEGDARDWAGYSEDARVKDRALDLSIFKNSENLDANIGRLKTTKANGDTDGNGLIDKVHAYGARSFSIWNEAGKLVFDSGHEFERITLEYLPAGFNASNDNSKKDDRSDDKGPEPEGVAIGVIDGRSYAFIGLERTGGLMVYDISSPFAPQFIDYVNNRDYSKTPGVGVDAGDLGPEGVLFIPADKSPNGKPLIAVGNEVSGTTTLWQVNLQ